ncbi:MAG: 8-amino-7-oxononanoate synthase [Pirellulaceae bacterium]|nr:8-amino-7-oxononanoate synthase [Planctomycetales bacterium]
MNPLRWIDDRLRELDARHLRRRLQTRRGPQDTTILIGERDDIGYSDEFVPSGRPLINLSANDYLGLARDPRLAEAARAEAVRSGWGAGASPLVTGRGAAQASLENAIAEFEQTEAALVFTSGFAANAGTIPALVGTGDHVLSDAQNHASIIDGCRLSGATIHVYRHRSVDHARDLLEQIPDSDKGHILMVTDTLFSMDGDLAPLAELAQLAATYQAMLMVDEAHATGVFGAAGRGVCEALGVEEGVHVRVGTLSKALGCNGGFVAGSRNLIDWLANRARSYVFSTALPGPVCAAAERALELVMSEPLRRERVLAHASYLRNALGSKGWAMDSSPSQIVPLRVGEPQRAVEFSTRLRQLGFLVPAIRPPSVPTGQSLLRISLNSQLDAEDLHQLVAACDMRSL